MVADPAVGFVPPPYPVRPARRARSGWPTRCRAASSTARSARRATRARGGASEPPRRRSRGRWATRRRPAVAALRDAAAAWIGRRFGVAVEAAHVGACVGTKELVASLPHLLRLRNPRRDTVLYPAVAYPTYEMGAILAGCRAVPVALDCAVASRPRRDQRRRRRARARAVGERARQPHVVGRRRAISSPTTAAWARERGIVVASDECYAEFAPEPATILAAGLDGVLAMHSLSKRSNLAGMRVGFYAGDPELVDVSRRDAQARRADGADADAGRRGRRARRRRPRRGAARPLRRTARVRARRARRRSGSCTTAGRARSTSGSGTTTAPTTVGRSRPGSRTSRACWCRPAISTARSAPITSGSRSCNRASASSSRFDRLAARRAEPEEEHRWTDVAKQITQLWEAGDAWRDVMPVRAGARSRAFGDRRARPRRGPRRRGRRRTCRRQRVGEARDPHVVPRPGDADRSRPDRSSTSTSSR